MKKLFYVLCMSALIFTGCSKSSPKSGGSSNLDDDDDTADMVKNFCEDHPESQLCQDLDGKIEATLQQVKPVQKLTLTGTEMLRGASNPSAWKKGYSNLEVGDKIYTTNFSVESGSILPVDSLFTSWDFNMNTGEVSDKKTFIVTNREGGNVSTDYGNEYKGFTVIRIVVFQPEGPGEVGKFFYLPPLRFAS